MEIIGEVKEEEKSGEKKEVPTDFNFHIEISLYPKDGKLEVKSNVRDIFLALGLLETAKDVVKGQIAQENKSRIVNPNSGGIVNFVRNLKN